MVNTFHLAVAASTIGFAGANTYVVPNEFSKAGQPLDSYVSYSLEFSSFPDFAGNKSYPNMFSYNMLNNLGEIMGAKPYIRVGGNTQDYALYDASQSLSLVGKVDPNRSPDYPTTIHIGPAYFESYDTWPDVKFSHGFNLGLGGNNSEGWQTLVDTIPLVCKILGLEKLYTWEYGNEPDLYSVSAQGPVRPATWNEASYVRQWHNGTKEIRSQIRRHCPELPASQPRFMAPSFAALSNPLKEDVTWASHLNKNADIELFSTHNYISGATSPGVTLQGTLMNHTRTKNSVDAHVDMYNKIFGSVTNIRAPPLIFGETNSLYNQGRPGLSNTFGAALWGIDFNLYSAAAGFKRVHMHQGTNYRYQAWQPVSTDKATMGTKAPYYGSIAVAAMLRNSVKRPVSISSIPLSSDQEAAYSAHYTPGVGRPGKLARIMVLNMRGYNTTVDGAGLEPLPDPEKRPSKQYSFNVSQSVHDGQQVIVQRLVANGSDAITGITFDSWSYNFELDHGKPVRLDNVTFGETAVVEDGVVTVDLLDSSAALLTFAKRC